MESFHWDDSFLTGISDVDEQHHRLVDVINNFGELVSGQQGPITQQAINQVFQELEEYTHYHFEEEEAFMDANGIDPRHLNPHIEAHRNFINEVQALSETLTPENRSGCEQAMKFLIHWLAYHILGTDQSMSRQMDSIRDGQSAAAAFDQEQQHQARSTGPLLSALNGLFQQVSARNRELSDLNRTLEQRVEERTRDLAEANRKLEVIALTDVLTGLPNRRHALQVFQDLWDNCPTLSCMMIDADGFKQINDTYGHDAGDEVLRQLSRTLKGSVRNDDVTARLGGDEFLIICPDTDLNGALLAAENMRQEVDAMRVPAGDEGVWKGSVSVGVASRSAQMRGPDDLIKAADNAVYIAKQDGRNCVRSTDVI